MLVNVPEFVTAFYTEVPDPSMPEQWVAFGTSGHRGSALEQNPTHGGLVTADLAVTGWIETKANEFLGSGLILQRHLPRNSRFAWPRGPGKLLNPMQRSARFTQVWRPPKRIAVVVLRPGSVLDDYHPVYCRRLSRQDPGDVVRRRPR